MTSLRLVKVQLRHQNFKDASDQIGLLNAKEYGDHCLASLDRASGGTYRTSTEKVSEEEKMRDAMVLAADAENKKDPSTKKLVVWSPDYIKKRIRWALLLEKYPNVGLTKLPLAWSVVKTNLARIEKVADEEAKAAAEAGGGGNDAAADGIEEEEG